MTNRTPVAQETDSAEISVLDVVPPEKIAKLVEEVGVKKINLPFISMLTLSILAGAFIALGGTFYTLVITGSELGFGQFPCRFSRRSF